MLNIFGGKDATIHYYMLHNHNNIRTNILNKYKVRRLEDTDKNNEDNCRSWCENRRNMDVSDHKPVVANLQFIDT
jgi:hypothetical protein